MSGRVTFEEVVSLRERLAAAEQRATESDARAEQLAARLQVAERVCEAVGMYESSTTAVVPYTEPRMRDAYVTWRNYVHDRAAPATQPDERAAAERAVIAAARPVLGMLRGTHSTFNTVIYSQALGDALEALDALDGAAKEV